MSLIKTGLTPARQIGSGNEAGGLRAYVLNDSTPEALFEGAPVIMNAGDLEVAAAGEAPIGVFIGANYVDNSTKRPRYVNHIPAGTSATAGNPIVAHIATDPNLTYVIQANSAVTDANVGGLYALTDLATGSDITGQSDCIVNTAGGVVLPAAAHVELIRIVDFPGNPAATPMVEVRLVNHAYGS